MLGSGERRFDAVSITRQRMVASLDRKNATSMERSMIFKRHDRGLTPEQISGRTGIPLHIVKNTLANKHQFKRRKQISAHRREELMRLQDELWMKGVECPFILTDVRTDRFMQRIGLALMGKLRNRDVDRLLKNGRLYLESFDDTLSYF